MDVKIPGVLVVLGGLAVLILPRASLRVVTPPGSSRTLFSISELEKVGRSNGRCLGLCEKNSGEDGAPSVLPGRTGVWKLSGSSVCRGLNNFGRILFAGGSDLPLSSDLGCFEACVAATLLDGRSGSRKEEALLLV